jgi:hypothetical protein
MTLHRSKERRVSVVTVVYNPTPGDVIFRLSASLESRRSQVALLIS